MAFVLQVSTRVQFRVAGTLRDDSGHDNPFDFVLTCRRLSVADYQAAITGKTDAEKTAALASWIEGWSGVKTAAGAEEPCTPEAIDALLAVPGMAGLVFNTYAWEASARAKN